MTLEQAFISVLGICCGALGWFARDPADALTLATLTPGQKAVVWNDGVTAFAGALA